jgi:hypothetical protein
MRFAMVDGQMVEAAPGAPSEALCPCCLGNLTLRKRRRMSGELSYFWRHRAYENPDCPARDLPWTGVGRQRLAAYSQTD